MVINVHMFINGYVHMYHASTINFFFICSIYIYNLIDRMGRGELKLNVFVRNINKCELNYKTLDFMYFYLYKRPN